jgi:hypothetical protein
MAATHHQAQGWTCETFAFGIAIQNVAWGIAGNFFRPPMRWWRTPSGTSRSRCAWWLH